MALLLNVPYSEKDEAKSLGAKWNPELKKWYVEFKRNYHKFRKWFNCPDTNLVVCKHLYIVVGEHTCFCCHNKTNVISFAADDYVMVHDEASELYHEDVNFISEVDNIPLSLQKYLYNNHDFYKDFSKFMNDSYFANHCSTCGTLQGNFFLHHEPDSPFFMSSEERASNLKIYSISLPHDLELIGSVGWCSGDYLIKQFSEFLELQIDLE